MPQLNAWFLLKRQGDKPHVIAHRGASGYAPENTLAAYQKALDLGIVAVETDVHQTQDGVIVTLHDDTLDRTTSGRGAVAERLWPMIQLLDAGSWYGSQFSSERVPSLEAYLSCLDGRAVPVIEIKGGVDVERRLAERFQGRPGGAFFFSFDADKIAALKAECADCPCLYLVPWTEEVVPCDAKHVEAAVDMRMEAIGVDWQRVSPEVVALAHQRGLSVFVYTVNTEVALQHCLDCGVDAVISDVPDQMLHALDGV